MDGMSLLDVLRGVMLDPAEQAAYTADPGAYLERFGYDDVDPADLSEAFGLVADTLPPDQAQAAWSAAADPDASSFGTVTADFDTEAGNIDNGVAPPEVDAEGPGAPRAEVDTDAEPEATLSFGEGDAGTSDLDHPSFDDATAAAPDGPAEAAGHGDAHTRSPGLDADAGADDADDIDGGLDDTGDAGDDGADDVGSGLDTQDDTGDIDSGLDDGFDNTDTGDDGFDDTDDLTEIDGLGGVDDPGPDDLDIGSF